MAEREGHAPGVEERDVDPRFPLTVGVGALVVIGLALLLAVYLVHNPFVRPEVPTPTRLGTAPRSAEHVLVHPADRLTALRAAAEQRLHSYGWVDRQAGVVHIPIERAMQLIVRRDAARRATAAQGGGGAP